jgi:septum site-determining protein MinC
MTEQTRRRPSTEPPETFGLPQVRLRGRSVLALVVAPELPVIDWFAAFDRQLAAAPDFFAERPIVADLGAVLEAFGPEALPILLDGFDVRNLKLIGIEGVAPGALENTPWRRLPARLGGREFPVQGPDPAAAPASSSAPASPDPAPEAAEPAATSLLIERPVRSGESIVFADGDVTIVGSVGSGAEVLAGGSIHVYGALRGRAIAGLRTGAGARIFCRRLEAEMVGVDQLYRTAEHWGAGLQGRAVQVMCDRGALRLAAFD